MTSTGTQTPPARSCTFGGLDIAYDERVIEPRAWTALQSRWAAELSPGLDDGPILEVCAGAGHIGLLAASLSGRTLVQVEADPVAARWAVHNAQHAGLGDRVEVRCVEMAHALRPDEVFALVVADPPYLPSADVTRWPEDPVRAIDGGPDGLNLVRECLALAAVHLTPGGRMLLQVAGTAQVQHVADLVADGGVLTVVEVRSHDEQRAVVALART